MSKRLIPVVSVMVVWLGLIHPAVYADGICGRMTPEQASKSVDVVFRGKVIAANQEAWRINRIRFERRRPFIHLTDDDDRYQTTFEVMEVWKGDITARTNVIHSLLSADSSYSFRRGEKYIVYASWYDGELYTSACYRNNLLSAAGEDLAAFGAGKPPLPNPSTLANSIGKLIAVFLLLALLGWAAWHARRKYGVQKS